MNALENLTLSMNNGHLQSIKNLVDFCTFHGLKEVVISPGSRSAPISILFSRCKKVKIHVVVDERSAAYFALGIALQKSRPVALVCTSGSASYNYAPAVSEAFYQRVPLLIFTADRPLHWLNHAESQQIDQTNLFGNHVSAFFTYDTDFLSGNQSAQSELVRKAFKSLLKYAAPVHINVPIPEPLYNLDNLTPCEYTPKEIQDKSFSNNAAEFSALSDMVTGNQKVLILLGQQFNNGSTKSISKLANQLSQVVILSDLLSNNFEDNTLHSIDTLLCSASPEETAYLKPEIVISIGTNHVSKHIKAFLRNTNLKEHIHIDANGWFPDTFKQLSRSISGDPEYILSQILRMSHSNSSDYKSSWLRLQNDAEKRLKSFMNNLSWDEFNISNIILKMLPADSVLHLGNSLSVRYFEWLTPRKDIAYYANRGTSGIDGSLSTAIGFSLASDKINTIVIGETSFMYDSNALWKETLPDNLRIIVQNNGGGGIFKFIDGPSGLPETDRIFAAKHAFNMQHLARHYSVAYMCASNINELTEALKKLSKINKTAILEIMTDADKNAQILTDFFKHLKHTSWQLENGKQ